MQPIRLVIVDDHQMVRSGFECLADGDPELEVVGSLDSRDAAIAFLRTNVPDVMLIDLSLQAGSGLELIQEIASREIPTRMLVVSMHDERLFAERCLRAGAHGYVCKTRPWSEIRAAILKVARGETAVSLEVSQRLIGRRTERHESAALRTGSAFRPRVRHLRSDRAGPDGQGDRCSDAPQPQDGRKLPRPHPQQIGDQQRPGTDPARHRLVTAKLCGVDDLEGIW